MFNSMADMHNCGYCESFFEEKEQRMEHRLKSHSEHAGEKGFCMFCVSLFPSYFAFLDHLDENHMNEKGILIEYGAPDGKDETILKMLTVAYRGIGNAKIPMDEMIEFVKKESSRVIHCDSDGNQMDKSNKTKEEIIEDNDVIWIGDVGRMNESPRPMIMEKEEIRDDEIVNEGELVVSSPTVGFLDENEVARDDDEDLDNDLKFLLKEETLCDVPEINWDAIQDLKPSMPIECFPHEQNANNRIEDNNQTDQNEKKPLITKPKFEEVYELYNEKEGEDKDESVASNRKRDHAKDSSEGVKKPRGLSTRNLNIPRSSTSTVSTSSMPHLEKESDDSEKIESQSNQVAVSSIANQQHHNPTMQQMQPIPQPNLQQPQSAMHQLQLAPRPQPYLAHPPSSFVPMNMGNQWGQPQSCEFMGQLYSPSLQSPMQPNGFMMSPSLSPNDSMCSPGTGMYQHATGTLYIDPNSFSPNGMGMHAQMNAGTIGFPRYPPPQYNVSYPPLLVEERGAQNDIDFLRGNSSDRCPQCYIAVQRNGRIPHYICHHFRIYYSQCRLDLSPMKRWLSIELGSEIENSIRMCPHCVNQVFTIGRVQLLNHFKESHFDKFLKLGREYTNFANTQCSNVALHQLLLFANSLNHP